jgi:hypothetical protein
MKVSKYVETVNGLYQNKKLSFEEKEELLNKYRYGNPKEKLELENDYKSILMSNKELKKDSAPSEKNQIQDKLDRIENKLVSISNKVEFIFWFVIIVIIINLYVTFKYFELMEQLDSIINSFKF